MYTAKYSKFSLDSGRTTSTKKFEWHYCSNEKIPGIELMLSENESVYITRSSLKRAGVI